MIELVNDRLDGLLSPIYRFIIKTAIVSSTLIVFVGLAWHGSDILKFLQSSMIFESLVLSFKS